eukprot:4172103-Pyramimonas_sp.AAC.1
MRRCFKNFLTALLRRDEWPESWSQMRNPACPLILSLYGHPDSGEYWEQHCEGHVTAKVYVDDFMLAAPADKLAQGWMLLQSPSP